MGWVDHRECQLIDRGVGAAKGMSVHLQRAGWGEESASLF